MRSLAVFRECKNLTDLYLFGAAVTEAGLANLRTAKPSRLSRPGGASR